MSRGVVWQELMKMFNDSDSFYYCENADVTSTIQRRHQHADVTPDDRFFWNKHMLSELVDSLVVHSISHVCHVIYQSVSQQHFKSGPSNVNHSQIYCKGI